MRVPVIISALLHLAFAILMITGLPTFFQAPQPKPPVIVPVDLVVIADETKVPSKKEKKPEAPKETKKEEPVPEPRRVAQPKPEPPKPEKKETVPPPPKQVKKEPPKPEPEVAKVDEKAEPSPMTTPKFKPKPPRKKKAEPKKPEFNENRIAALLDKLAKDAPKVEVAEKDQVKKVEDKKSDQRISLADQATATEKDFLQQQIQNCWSIPSGVPYSDDLFAVVTVRLNADGTYAGPILVDNPSRMNQPGQQFYRTFVESAVRAVQICEPLKMPVRNGVPFVPREDVEFAFDPRKLLGG